jgi:hypothetical protein
MRMSENGAQWKGVAAETRDRFVRQIVMERRMSQYTGRNYAQSIFTGGGGTPTGT